VGYFNTIFHPKTEYMENLTIMEPLIAKMLAEDADLKAYDLIPKKPRH